MFCDLVGSTALSARLDPEDLRDAIGTYHKCVTEVVGSLGGFVAKYMGDGVLAYFGYPRAQEDDAERAVRTGLALIDAVGRSTLAPGHTPQVRIGIATGLVVVGDLIGEGAAREQAVVGETPNLAARLQAFAEPGTVAIADSTRHLVSGLFEYRDLGAVYLKGFATPLQAWQVTGASVAASRFEALHAGAAFTPLVGREQEIDLVLRRWRQARDGDGQVLLLSGEPGIGKSRMAAALHERLRDELHTRLRYFCLPHHQDSALHPVIGQLERVAGFGREDAAAVRLAKLDALLARTSAGPEDQALLAELLALPAAEHHPRLDLNPQQRKAKTLETLVRQLEALAGERPVLVIFEDVHWIDPTSLELLSILIEHVASMRALFVVTFRPEFAPPWTGRQHVNLLTLTRLDRPHAVAVAEHVTRGKTLPPEVLEEIVARTDGVPLFLEELTKTVIEGDLLRAEGDRYTLRGTLPALAVPTTLHASLIARFDRLSLSRSIVQFGAAIGREFSYELIRAVSPLPERELEAALAELVASELVFPKGAPPNAVYSFKHALVQDAAYSTLLRRDRQELHARIARIIEERFPERVTREPELLAHHFTEARQTERAVGYWLRAGERAAERSANLEAIRHFSRGLEALRTLPESPERDRQELAFQIAIGTPLIAVHGYAAPQTGAAFGRARVLCERLGEAEPLVATLSGEFVYHFVRGNCPMMRQLADEARHVSERLSNPVVRLASHRLAGITAMHVGAFPEACAEFEAILHLYDASEHRSQPVHYVHDPNVSALTYLAPVLWILGFPDQARRSSIAAFRCAAELNQANLAAHVRVFAGAGLHELLGNAVVVRANADEIVELADRHSLGYWRLNGLILRGWAMVQEGDLEAGITLMRQNIADRAALGVSWYQARYLCMLAAAYGQLGQAELGLRVIAEAKDLIARNDEHMWQGEVNRIEGELRQAQGASVLAIEACFTRAIAITRQQSAKSLELRAANSLARLLRDRRRSDVRALLAPIYDWFTEGFDTPDLKAAKALLEELT
jgi:predicted ATPase/class 3 adenylate cyclase